MSHTPQDNVTPPLPVDPGSADDIEIIEVVDVDENGVARAPSAPEEGAHADDGTVSGDGSDVEIIFEEEEVAKPRPRPAPPLGGYAPPVEDVDLRERLLRLVADFENYKKRVDRERLDHFRFATFELIGRILPVLDNFERAIVAARAGVPGDPLVEGLALIQRQLLTELEAEGLRGMDSVGDRFDPERHEAVATDTESAVPPHTVTQEFQRGYFLHDRVLRPAMVRVRVDESDGGTANGNRKES